MPIQKRSRVVSINGFISIMYKGERHHITHYRNFKDRKEIIERFKKLKFATEWHIVIEPNTEDLKRSKVCKQINESLCQI